MVNAPEKWSNLEEIAEHLGVSKDTIRNWIKKGVNPHHPLANNTSSIFRKLTPG